MLPLWRCRLRKRLSSLEGTCCPLHCAQCATVQAGGLLVHIETQSGKEILTFEPNKEYQSVLLSSSELQKGETYVVYAGGSSTGSVTDDLYAGGVYTPGTRVTSLTISSIVTGGGPGGRGALGGMPPPRP